jgi:hypothetical protein
MRAPTKSLWQGKHARAGPADMTKAGSLAGGYKSLTLIGEVGRGASCP